MKAELLALHLSIWRKTAFVWGAADCFMSVFNYCNDFGYPDLGAPWRGTYHDEAGASRVLEAAGGGLSGMTAAMAAAGIPTTTTPERGDPVCVAVDGHQIGGIYLGMMTALRLADRGQIDARIKHIGAWRI